MPLHELSFSPLHQGFCLHGRNMGSAFDPCWGCHHNLILVFVFIMAMESLASFLVTVKCFWALCVAVHWVRPTDFVKQWTTISLALIVLSRKAGRSQLASQQTILFVSWIPCSLIWKIKWFNCGLISVRILFRPGWILWAVPLVFLGTCSSPAFMPSTFLRTLTQQR